MNLQIKKKEFPFSEIQANITFHSGSLKVFMAKGSYLVKWFKDEEFIGEMSISTGYWGSFPHGNEIKDWIIEFWKDDEVVHRHFYSVNRANVLLLPKKTGLNHQEFKIKILNIANEIKEMGGNVWIYFDGSHEFNFSEFGITPLKLAPSPEMNFILDIN